MQIRLPVPRGGQRKAQPGRVSAAVAPTGAGSADPPATSSRPAHRQRSHPLTPARRVFQDLLGQRPGSAMILPAAPGREVGQHQEWALEGQSHPVSVLTGTRASSTVAARSSSPHLRVDGRVRPALGPRSLSRPLSRLALVALDARQHHPGGSLVTSPRQVLSAAPGPSHLGDQPGVTSSLEVDGLIAVGQGPRRPGPAQRHPAAPFCSGARGDLRLSVKRPCCGRKRRSLSV